MLMLRPKRRCGNTNRRFRANRRQTRKSWRKSGRWASPPACPSLGTELPRIAKMEGSGQVLMRSRKQLANGFRRLGVGACDMVMLHASVRAVGEIAGGPDQIHPAFKDVITREGTLMMYARCPVSSGWRQSRRQCRHNARISAVEAGAMQRAGLIVACRNF